MNRIELQLLDGFAVRVDGVAQAFARRKTQALLVYLVLHTGLHSRERLCEVLWPHTPVEDARRALRVCLSELRKVLGESTLANDEHKRLGLAAHALACDALDALHCLQQRHQGEALDAVLRLPHAALLPDWSEEWIEPLRQQLQRALHAALRQGAAQARQGGDHARCLALAQRALALDCTDEICHQHVLASLVAQGEYDNALAHYAVCCEALRTHLDTTPQPGTQSIVEALRQRLARTHAPRLSTLPQSPTRFIGREDELNEIETALPAARLLTLVGPGGSGKTRLALQAAHEVLHDYPGGVWWVDLAAVGDAALVVPAVAQVLGVREQDGQALASLVARQLGAQRTLLVLDNCEHLLHSVATALHTWLAGCASLTVLATSREALGLSAERLWDTPALPLPPPQASVAHWLDNPCVRLFLERATGLPKSVVEDTRALAHVVDLCIRLQGIPLALELAAAQCAHHPLQALGARLGEVLAFARDDTPSRHQTLRGALQWSYALLENAEQTLLRRLHIFAGGCTVDAAAQVAAGYPCSDTPLHSPRPTSERAAPTDEPILSTLAVTGAAVTRHLLDALARKALVQRLVEPHGVRYALLETVRQWGRELCQQHGEVAALQYAHRQWCLRLAQSHAADLWGAAQTRASAALQHESANLDAALEAACAAAPGTPSDDALALCNTLARWWQLTSQFSRAQRWLAAALKRLDAPAVHALPHASPPQCPAPLRVACADAWAWLSDTAYRRSEALLAQSCATHACALLPAPAQACAPDVMAVRARAWAARAMASWLADDHARAQTECAHAWDDWSALGDQRGMALAAIRLAEITRLQARWAASEAYNAQARDLSAALGERRGEAVAILNLGLIAVEQGHWQAGCTQLQTAGRLFLEVGERHHWTYVLQGLGQSCQGQGLAAQAAFLYGALHAYQAHTGFSLFGPDARAHQQRQQALLGSDPCAHPDLAPAWARGAALDVEGAVQAGLAHRCDATPTP